MLRQAILMMIIAGLVSAEFEVILGTNSGKFEAQGEDLSVRNFCDF